MKDKAMNKYMKTSDFTQQQERGKKRNENTRTQEY